METIKLYLESLFASLPNTQEVLKAKFTLLQMMEDKYAELRAGGASENEAVGTVISEFGNLEELSESLGIENVVGKTRAVNRRLVPVEDVRGYLADKATSAYRISLGVLLCVCSAAPLVLLSALSSLGLLDDEAVLVGGLVLLFAAIAVAVGLFISAHLKLENWDFLHVEPCTLDFATVEFVRSQKAAFRPVYEVLTTVGVVLCVVSVVPVIVAGSLDVSEGWETLCAALILVLVGLGALLLTNASVRNKGFQFLLGLNDEGTVAGSYAGAAEKGRHYRNKVVAAVMSEYWATVTCLYFIISFLSGAWAYTWLLWLLAPVVRRIVITCWADDEN